jgi:hypothetical protein
MLLFKPPFSVVAYFVSYDYIVKKCVVNKAKTEMKCNGKCHSTKELARVAHHEPKESNEKKW